MIRRVLTTCGFLALSWGVTAQQAAQDGFKPFDENAPRETLPAAPLIFVAYAVAWLALALYVFTVVRKVAKLETDLAQLRNAKR